jgi:hypothetical protein
MVTDLKRWALLSGEIAWTFFSATVQVQIDGQQVDVFRYIVPVDLTTIFTGYGALPL